MLLEGGIPFTFLRGIPYKLGLMNIEPEDDDENVDYQWVDEDENEVPEDRGTPLSSMNRVAAWIFGALVGLFVLYLIMKVMLALADYFG